MFQLLLFCCDNIIINVKCVRINNEWWWWCVKNPPTHQQQQLWNWLLFIYFLVVKKKYFSEQFKIFLKTLKLTPALSTGLKLNNSSLVLNIRLSLQLKTFYTYDTSAHYTTKEDVLLYIKDGILTNWCTTSTKLLFC